MILTFKPKNLQKNANANGNHIRMCLIPGHASIKENELVDQAATNAITNPLATIVTFVTRQDLILLIIIACNQKWQDHWSLSNSRLYETKPNMATWPLPIGYPENLKSSRLRIGHTQISHNDLMAKNDPPICAFCDTRLTIKHIMSEYSTYTHKRQESNLPNNLAISLRQEITSLVAAFKFIKLVELQNKL